MSAAAAHCGCVVAGVVAGVVATARCGVREAMFIPFIGHECPIRGWPHAWQRLPFRPVAVSVPRAPAVAARSARIRPFSMREKRQRASCAVRV